jgi:hypothetical protein
MLNIWDKVIDALQIEDTESIDPFILVLPSGSLFLVSGSGMAENA